jgi:small subunit ribosomal protein S8
MHTDPISDLLTRIRNAQAVGKPEVVLPYSKLKASIAELLHKEGWLAGVEKVAGVKFGKKEIKSKSFNKKFDYLKIVIKYEDAKPKIKSIKRISKPGRRVYVGKGELPYVLSNYGIAVISTSQGLMTNKKARQLGVGGEILCELF